MIAAIVCMAIGTWSAVKHPKDAYDPVVRELPGNYLVRALAHWDAGWYVRIAEKGYGAADDSGQTAAAFFPLYPLAIAMVSTLGVNPYAAGVIVSVLCGIAAIFVFRRWAELVIGEQPATEAALLLSLYPCAIYLYGIVYSDGLFLLLVTSSFYFLERRKLLPATLIGILATAARPVAPALVLGLIVRNAELQRKRGEKWGVSTIVPAIAVLGMLAYMAYLGWKLGDPLAFEAAQGSKGWDNTPGLHTWLKFEWFRILSETTRPLIVARLGGHALATVVGLALIWPTWKRLGIGYAVYCAVAIGLPAVASHDFQGLGRYLMAAFPIFATATLLLRTRPRLQLAWLAFSSVVMFALAWSFGQGGYVA